MKKDKYPSIVRTIVLICTTNLFYGYATAQPSYTLNPGGNEPSLRSVNIDYHDAQTALRHRILNYTHTLDVIFWTKKGSIHYQCPLTDINNIPATQLDKATAEEQTTYYNNAVKMTNSCLNFYVYEINGAWGDIIDWALYISDGHNINGAYTGIYIEHIKDNPSTPTTCQAEIFDNMDFGNVKADSMRNAIGVLSVVCDKKTSVSIVVNSGHDLSTGDGGLISFEVQSPQDLTPGIVTSIPIKGLLLEVPSSPGSYRWATSLLITYQ